MTRKGSEKKYIVVTKKELKYFKEETLYGALFFSVVFTCAFTICAFISYLVFKLPPLAWGWLFLMVLSNVFIFILYRYDISEAEEICARKKHQMDQYHIDFSYIHSHEISSVWTVEDGDLYEISKGN